MNGNSGGPDDQYYAIIGTGVSKSQVKAVVSVNECQMRCSPRGIPNIAPRMKLALVTCKRRQLPVLQQTPPAGGIIFHTTQHMEEVVLTEDLCSKRLT